MPFKLSLAAALAVAVAPSSAAAAPAATPFVDHFSQVTRIASAVPAHGPATGDQNPYGVAVVPTSVGRLIKGDILVSNFNNAANQQGTGSSIVEISPSGSSRVFAVVPRPTSAPAVGLTTALVALRGGLVVVGSLPAPGGKPQAASAGALSILSPGGKVLETIRGRDIDGPWDMTAVQRGERTTLFLTNVLVGSPPASFGTVRTATIARIVLSTSSTRAAKVVSRAIIATGFAEHLDPSALVVGPTGVALGADGTLYVADSAGNRIAAIPHALTRTRPVRNGGRTVSSGGDLNDPLGMTIAPGGGIVTANGGDGNLVETLPTGRQVAIRTLVPDGAGDLFGLALAPDRRGIYFVDDAGSGGQANSLELLH